MAHLSLEEAFEVLKGQSLVTFRGVQRPSVGMNRACWSKACTHSKLYKPEQFALCMIAFDGATQGASIMDFTSFQVALDIVGKHKKMSGTDIGAYLTHAAMKIVEENSAKGIVRKKQTKESMKEDIRKAMAKAKGKTIPPPPAKEKPKPTFKQAAKLVSAANAFKNIMKEKVEGREKEAGEDEEDEKKPSSKASAKEEEDKDDDVPDIKAIAARNQYLEKQAQLLADLNSRLAEKRTMTDRELKKDPYKWEAANKEKTTTHILEHPAYWDWA